LETISRLGGPKRLVIVGISLAAAFSAPAFAHPAGDLIPQAFRGLYARSATACKDAKDLAFLRVTGDHLEYYEADEYLILERISTSMNRGGIPKRLKV